MTSPSIFPFIILLTVLSKALGPNGIWTWDLFCFEVSPQTTNLNHLFCIFFNWLWQMVAIVTSVKVISLYHITIFNPEDFIDLKLAAETSTAEPSSRVYVSFTYFLLTVSKGLYSSSMTCCQRCQAEWAEECVYIAFFVRLFGKEGLVDWHFCFKLTTIVGSVGKAPVFSHGRTQLQH